MDVAMATNFGRNLQNDLHLAGRDSSSRPTAVLDVATILPLNVFESADSKIFNGNIVATFCAIQIKIGRVT